MSNKRLIAEAEEFARRDYQPTDNERLFYFSRGLVRGLLDEIAELKKGVNLCEDTIHCDTCEAAKRSRYEQ